MYTCKVLELLKTGLQGNTPLTLGLFTQNPQTKHKSGNDNVVGVCSLQQSHPWPELAFPVFAESLSNR